MSRIILTGSTGNIGKYLSKYLKAAKADFIAGVTTLASKIEFENQGINAQIFSFEDKSSLCSLFENGDRLFLLNPLVEQMHDYIDNALEAAKETGIRFVLRNSGFGADANSAILLNKLQGTADEMVISSGIKYTIARPNSFMQNYSVYYGEMIKHTNSIFLGHGAGKVSHIDIRNFAELYSQILITPDEYSENIYDLTGDEAISNYEIADIISECTAKKVTYIPISDDEGIEGMKKAGMPPWNIEVLTSMNQMIRDNSASEITSTYKNLTGQSTISFNQFALEHSGVWK